jgi:hypothetical protein
MVKVEKELGLAACISCGVTSDEGSEITRITFKLDNSSYAEAICLCEECKTRLLREIASEIIYCKDCKHCKSTEFSTGRKGFMCMKWILETDSDWYCSRAERETE